jgi:hypothetical protein
MRRRNSAPCERDVLQFHEFFSFAEVRPLQYHAKPRCPYRTAFSPHSPDDAVIGSANELILA